MFGRKKGAPRAKRERSTSVAGHYVRNADLLPAVIEAKRLNRVTNELIVMLQKIAERYSRKGNFVGYSFREDMVSAAVENLCKNALKFNSEKYSNPFAFYTTAIHNSFLQYMADEKKHRNIRDALLIDAGANPSFNFGQSEKSESETEIPESDLASDKPQKIDDDFGSAVEKSTIYNHTRSPGPLITFRADEVVLDPVRNIYVRRSELQE